MINNGDLVNERYLVKSHVGRGGMQEVFLARDLLLEIDVALKTPQVGQETKGFNRSAKVAARVNHHNVAKTFDCFEENDRQYLIEEFVEGESLDKKLESFGFLDPHLGARIFHYLAKGIAASHAVGVIHRDLKPSNIMVSKGASFQNLKITDFGIATLTEEVFDEIINNDGDMTRSTSGTVKGALPYMAPEMMFKTPDINLGSAIDVWSLGAMMFKLLTSEYPFGTGFHAAVNVKNQERKSWPSFMTANPQFAPLAEDLQKLVDSCLNYDADERVSAKEIVERCENLCYSIADRSAGVVNSFRPASGFLTKNDGTSVFFSFKSVYGPVSPNLNDKKYVSFSSYPGKPHPRAHPVIVVNSKLVQ